MPMQKGTRTEQGGKHHYAGRHGCVAAFDVFARSEEYMTSGQCGNTVKRIATASGLGVIVDLKFTPVCEIGG